MKRFHKRFLLIETELLQVGYKGYEGSNDQCQQLVIFHGRRLLDGIDLYHAK